MKDKLNKFFMGRYGNDSLNRFIYILAFISLFLRLILRNEIFYIPALIFIALIYFRTLSRDIQARSNENQKYIQISTNVKKKFYQIRNNIFGSKDFKYIKCESCKTSLKIPKRKGKIKVICPKCKAEFIKRT